MAAAMPIPTTIRTARSFRSFQRPALTHVSHFGTCKTVTISTEVLYFSQFRKYLSAANCTLCGWQMTAISGTSAEEHFNREPLDIPGGQATETVDLRTCGTSAAILRLRGCLV